MNKHKITLEQLDTRIDTPSKTFTSSFNHKHQQSQGHLNPENSPTQPLSQTQNNLYSRSIVKRLLLASNNKSIRHQINQVHKESPLYAKPHRYHPSQFHFDSIPPTNQHYSSSCSNKIKTIHDGLRLRTTSDTKKPRYASQKKATVSQGNNNVSISGLVTYKFNSINAKRSLGFNMIDHEQTMKEEIKKATNVCQTNRFKKILFKKTHKKYKQKMRQDRGILSNFQSTTTQYLKERMHQKQQQQLVYGQKAKKLRFIKEYMHSEKAKYDEGRHIIDQIEKSQPKEQIEALSTRKCKTQKNEDLQLQQRLMPVQRNRVHIRVPTFVD